MLRKTLRRERNEQRKDQSRSTSAGRTEPRRPVGREDVQERLRETVAVDSETNKLLNQLEAQPESPQSSSGDTDAAWQCVDSGEEMASGSNATSGQDVVEEIGKATGLTYQDNEPLHSTEKLERRDKNRWELHPASSEDFNERTGKR
jgi:Family of unknown function (DUF6335)